MAWWKLLTANLRKVQKLSWSERWLLVQAFWLLPLTALSLHCLGLRRICDISARWHPPPQNPGGDSEQLLCRAFSTAQLVQAAARYGLCSPKCLSKSLVLWWLLKRQGIPGVLRIGVSPLGERLEAHAWVEFQGVVLNDSDDVHQRYAPFHGDILGRQPGL